MTTAQKPLKTPRNLEQQHVQSDNEIPKLCPPVHTPKQQIFLL